MAVDVRSHTAGPGGSLAKPSGTVEGDFLIAFSFCDPDAAVTSLTAPGDWTKSNGDGSSGSTMRGRVFTKVAGPSEPASYTFGAGSGTDHRVVIVCLTGVDPTSPVTVAATWAYGLTPGTNVTAFGITPDAAGALLCGFCSQNAGTFSTPAGMTEIVDSNGGWTAVAVDWQTIAGGVTTGARQAVHSVSQVWISVSIGVRAAETTTPVSKTAGGAAGAAGGAAKTTDTVEIVSKTVGGAAGAAGAGVKATGLFEPPTPVVHTVQPTPREPPPPPPPPPPLRFRAQLLDGTWLHHDLEVTDPEITYQLSGPTQITGSFDPEIADLRDLGFVPNGTWIWVEQDDQIRAGGILQDTGKIEGEALSFEALGFAWYATRWPYRGTWPLGSPVGVSIDPLDVVRYLWEYLQEHPRRDLGVTVDTTTSPIRIGTPERDVNFETSSGDQVEFTEGPYRLDWFESELIGEEINKLATNTPFDYRERYSWNAPRTAVLRHLELGYPRLGTRRHDLRFAQDENVDDLFSIAVDPDAFASHVWVHGAGEGAAKVWGEASVNIPGVLPIAVVIEDGKIKTKAEATKRASEELAKRAGVYTGRLQVDEVVMPLYNEHAPFGSFHVGDEGLVVSDFAWIGHQALWHRITGIKVNATEETMTLSLRRTGDVLP